MAIDDDSITDFDEPVSDRSHRRGGLTTNLWRLAIVVGIAQFSMSIWLWQFGIYMETLFDFWQIGITFSIGTLATIIGFLSSGIISDMLGRKKTLIFAFIPMGIGLLLLVTLPIWPLFPIFFGVIEFGWSFVLITARAGPADQIAQDEGKNSARVFNMVLMPAFVMDGLSPIVASLLLMTGFNASFLLQLGAIGTIISMVTAIFFFKETLTIDVKTKAREGPIIAIRGLGSNFWKLVIGVSGYNFAFSMAIPYMGNLVVNEWLMDEALFGLAWGASSFMTAILMLGMGGSVDKRIKGAFAVGLLFDAAFLFGFGLGSGVILLFLLCMFWSVPIVMIIGAERTLIVDGVSEEMKGRALGTYQVIMSTLAMAAQSVGALIWTISGSLRFLWVISGVLAVLFLGITVIALHSMKSKEAIKTEHI
ncbi:MAG: MFS transporter [Candidatus Thorarchaeota archaeon]